MIRQELNPETCRLDEKHINLRRYTPDRHCETGSILWRDGKNHQNDVTTSYATASRCVTTVPFSWRDGQNHQMMWPPAMQQHPGASLQFHFVARRIESPRAGTRYCVQYLIHQMSAASLARLGQMAPCPALIYINRGFTSVQMCHTHTHITHNLLTHGFLVAHANPSPSLFSFLHFPCHLYLSFAACWKKLTCWLSGPLFFLSKPWKKRMWFKLETQ